MSQSETINTLAGPLLAMARNGDLAGFSEELASVKVGQLSALAKETEFHEALFLLADIAASDAEPLRRLTALSLVGKANKATQRRATKTTEACRRAVRFPPPRLQMGDDQPLDADGREYIADTLMHADGEWLVPYAAQALLDETKSDLARAALASLVFERTPSVAQALDIIADSVPGTLFENPGRKEPELARTKRLARLCAVLESGVRKTSTESGVDLPKSLNRLLHSLAFRFSRPTGGVEANEATEAAAASIMTLVSALVRTRFSISAEPESYESIGRLRTWFGHSGWPADLQEARARLMQSVREAIILRAKMQLPSRELFSVLIQLTGDRRTAEKQIVPIADLPGIPSEVQDWLRSGAKRTATREKGANLEEAGLRDADELIALVGVRAAKLRSLAENEIKTALATMRELPELAEPVRTMTQVAAFARAIPQDLDLLLQRRSLSLFGVPGEKAQNDPTRHEPADGDIIDRDLVEIVSPGVQRRLPNGTTVVIRKASVRAA